MEEGRKRGRKEGREGGSFAILNEMHPFEK